MTESRWQRLARVVFLLLLLSSVAWNLVLSRKVRDQAVEIEGRDVFIKGALDLIADQNRLMAKAAGAMRECGERIDR